MPSARTMPVDLDLYSADEQLLSGLKTLPHDFDEAVRAASSSDFVAKYLSPKILESYRGR